MVRKINKETKEKVNQTIEEGKKASFAIGVKAGSDEFIRRARLVLKRDFGFGKVRMEKFLIAVRDENPNS